MANERFHAGVSESEIVTIYPHRWSVPREAWSHLFAAAKEEIGILVYSGLFLADDEIRSMLRDKAEDGVQVRIMVGDPDSGQLMARGADERIDDALSAKARNAIALLRPLADLPGIEIHTHGTTLYNSIYRADDQLLVNTHIYGAPSSLAPVLHLRALAGGNMVTTYLESFERVWAVSQPLPPLED
jgi:hypothetical protein